MKLSAVRQGEAGAGGSIRVLAQGLRQRRRELAALLLENGVTSDWEASAGAEASTLMLCDCLPAPLTPEFLTHAIFLYDTRDPLSLRSLELFIEAGGRTFAPVDLSAGSLLTLVRSALQELDRDGQATALSDANVNSALLIAELEDKSAALADANINSALLVAEIEERNQIIEAGKRKLQALLDHLDQGFMTCDRTGRIEENCSAAVQLLFGVDPVGKKLHELLEIRSDQVPTHERWLQSLFEEPIPFASLAEIGEKEFETPRGRQIALDYRPIRDAAGRVERVIAIATDKTVENQLRKQAVREAAMVKMAMAVLRDPCTFPRFQEALQAFLSRLKELSTSLPSTPEDLAAVATELFRGLHLIKGDASGFHALSLRDVAHSLETELQEIGVRPEHSLLLQFTRHAQLRLETALNDFVSENAVVLKGMGKQIAQHTKPVLLEAIRDLSYELEEQLGAGAQIVEQFYDSFILEPIDLSFYRYETLIDSLADQLGKKVRFEVASSVVRVAPDAYASLIGSCLHVFRNALDHGIEKPALRRERGKPEVGKVEVTCTLFKREGNIHREPGVYQDWVRISIQDDGSGISVDDVARVAVKRGMISPKELARLDDSQTLQLVFLPGFSTRADVSTTSGRGVGLDSVKAEVDRLGGVVWVESEEKVHTTLWIEVPVIRRVVPSRFGKAQRPAA